MDFLEKFDKKCNTLGNELLSFHLTYPVAASLLCTLTLVSSTLASQRGMGTALINLVNFHSHHHKGWSQLEFFLRMLALATDFTFGFPCEVSIKFLGVLNLC